MKQTLETLTLTVPFTGWSRTCESVRTAVFLAHLDHAGGNVTRAARSLQIDRSYIYDIARRSPALRAALRRSTRRNGRPKGS